MNTNCCCTETSVLCATQKTSSPGKINFLKRVINAMRLVLPGTVLALLPKCPLCLAAYISLSTGMGISIASATWLRALLAMASVSSLIYVVAKKLLISNSFIQLNDLIRKYLYALNYVMIALCVLFASAWVNHI